MTVKMFPAKQVKYVYLIVKSKNQKFGETLVQSDQILSTHATRESAEKELVNLKPDIASRSFIRYQIRKFLIQQ